MGSQKPKNETEAPDDILLQTLDKIRGLRVWERRGERAPHKPLLLLLALAKAQQGFPRLLPWNDIEVELARLLEDFGPTRLSNHPEYPFWHLRNDELWEVVDPDLPGRRQRGGGKLGNPRITELRRCNTKGGLPPTVFQLTTHSSIALSRLVTDILDRNFPVSFHDDILEQTGLQIDSHRGEPQRDPTFEAALLRAYNFECAVCGFCARLGTRILGVEQTFIRWPQAGGPVAFSNALALCLLHKKAFERGAFSVDPDGLVVVSAALAFGDNVAQTLRLASGQKLRPPKDEAARPDRQHLKWHRQQVFRTPAATG